MMTSEPMMSSGMPKEIANRQVNLDEPRYDQSNFAGRLKHFAMVTNPLTVFASSKQLDDAKSLVELYRAGNEPAGTSIDDVWAAKVLYDSAFHPQTGEKQNVVGRMSFQVPGNMSITGCMMTFYRTAPAIVFWQWINQSFNALVNYTNRNASSPITTTQLGQAYAMATAAGCGVGIFLTQFVAKNPAIAGGLIARLVPFVAVASANCVNIPLMRQHELKEGIDVSTAEGEVIGKSRVAAKSALAQVVPSRIGMATPAMIIPPIIMNALHKNQKSFVRRMPWCAAPVTVLLTGLVLVISTPVCCSIFPQKSSIAFKTLDPQLQEKLRSQGRTPEFLYYNKGL